MADIYLPLFLNKKTITEAEWRALLGISTVGDAVATAASEAAAREALQFPGAFTDNKGKGIRVNAAETAFEYVGYPVRNTLINGNLNIWQAGTSFTGLTSSAHVADTVRFELGSSGTWTVEQSTDVPTVSQAKGKLNFSMRAVVTTADATVGAGDSCTFYFNVEGYDYAPIYQQPQAISLWVKGNKTGVYGVSIRNQPGTRTYVGTISIDQADTWENKVIQISSAPDDGATWNFTNGQGLLLFITLVAGADLHGAAGQWNNGNFRTTDQQVNLADTIGNEIYVADVRLVPGLDASNIIVPSFAEQFGKAERYYQIVHASAAGTAAAASAIAVGEHTFTTAMRTTPTLAELSIIGGAANLGSRTHTAHSAKSGRMSISSAAAGNFFANGVVVAADARIF